MLLISVGKIVIFKLSRDMIYSVSVFMNVDTY